MNINPSLTIAPPSSFLTETQGYTQGLVLDDPVARQWLLSGTVDASVTQPVWGGLPIQELVQNAADAGIGSSIKLATSSLAATGFAVMNRAHSMLTTPGNNVPIALAGMSVPYYRLGSGARVPVPCSAALVAALQGATIATSVSWNYTTNLLDTSGTALDVKVVDLNSNSKIVAYNSGTQAVTWSTGSVAIIQL